MTIDSGTRLGPYEVISSLGAGGMGEVYRAIDTRLERHVAIKVIAGIAAGDADLRQRFEREARTISQLNHPHICALYDVGQHQDVSFLVMELIEGEPLSDRLARGPMPIQQALRTASEIADALSAAHRRGIVHRDLKPGNVMLTKSGAKLLDFGLAKTAAPALHAGVTGLPTSPATLTARGTILGTFQYMAPEQLEGREADARSDIFAFGSMVFEMLTGRRAFEAGSHAGLISAIMTAEPPRVAALQPLAPAGIDYIVTRCLAKDPDDRWQSAKDLGAELRRVAGATQIAETSQIGSGSGTAAVVPRRRGTRLPWVLAAGAAAAAIAAVTWAVVLTRRPVVLPTQHLAVPLVPADGLDGRFALSPDGTKLAFIAQKEARTQLFLRSLDQSSAVLLASATSFSSGGPAFSADGNWVVFAGSTKLWKVPISGGAATAITPQVNSASGRPTWALDGTIVYENAMRGLSAIRPEGGEPRVVTRISDKEFQHFGPWLTRDAKTLFFTVRRAESDYEGGMDIVAQSMETGARKVVVDGFDPLYLESGHLMFVRDGTVYSMPFDVRALQKTGDPVPVVQGVGNRSGAAMYAASQTGSIAYMRRDEGGVGDGYLALVDHTGATTVAKVPPHRYSDPRVSPDGHRVAVHVFEEGRENYIADLTRGTLMRVTFDGGEDETPIWSPDGQWVAYSSTRTGFERAIFRRRADGSGVEEQLWTGKGHVHLGSFTPDGRTIVLALSEEREFYVATLALGEKAFKPLLQTRSNIVTPALSPDGNWLAYVSDETGRPEVYVQPYPSLNGRWPISTNGGAEPVWARNGRRLYYRGAPKIMAVDITTSPSFAAGVPVALFDDRYLATQGAAHTGYDAAADGQLLMIARTGAAQTLPMHVNLLVNWRPGR
jgi:eukaryotic-like serine/threonine-protein kinase